MNWGRRSEGRLSSIYKLGVVSAGVEGWKGVVFACGLVLAGGGVMTKPKWDGV